MAASKALDSVFGVDPPPAAKRIRELVYCAFYVTDHITHFFALGGPDLLLGPDAPASERNLMGVIAKLGPEAARDVIECRKRNHQVIKTLGGRPVHPAAGLPGGWSQPVSKDARAEAEAAARANIGFCLFALRLFEQRVLGDGALREMVFSDAYLHKMYSIGTVDARNQNNFYDGELRVVAPDGEEFARFRAADYAAHIAERVEPWSYLKFPFLRQIGWKGFVDGPESGLYFSSPLSRLNVSDGLATPLANEHYERLYSAFGAKRIGKRYAPVHHRLATHWARLIEALYASERMLELATDPEILSPQVRRIPERITGEGIGQVEAPRGCLIHHYQTDERGVLTRVNLVVGTTHNHAAMSMSIARAAREYIRAGEVVSDGLLNRVEMAFRLYDPCLSCATHSLPGSMPLTVEIRAKGGELMRTLRREGGK